MGGDLNHFIDNVQIVEYGGWGVDDLRGTCLTLLVNASYHNYVPSLSK